MSRAIRAILFDLGGTLMHAGDFWAPFEARADHALAESLRRDGLDVPRGFSAELRARLADYFAEREESLVEVTYYSVVREMLAEKGHRDVPDTVIRAALAALYAVTRENWILERDTLLMFRMLESAGYRMGLVSNAGDDEDVRMLARGFGLEPYFDFILTSAACGYRKPHPRIYQLALANWSFPAGEVAMVGDTLEADILGAQQAGLYSIWITRRARTRGEEAWITPDAEVTTLLEIPELLGKIA
jgi:putative hydrolase of the HAD superfamily